MTNQHHGTQTPRLTRRGLLQSGGAGLLAGAASLPFLTNCSGDTSPAATNPSNASGGTTLTPPEYLPYTGLKADLPGTKDGVPAGYYTYPSDPPASVSGVPGKGGTVTALEISFWAPPTPESRNAAWQEIEKRVGSKLKINQIAPGDYQAKFSTSMAGGDLPDFMMYTRFKPVPHLLQFLQAKCTDLTPYLSGDGIKAWPNLANIPTFAWQNSSLNGKIWGLPLGVQLAGSGHWYYQNMLSEAGGQPPKNADDFLSLLKEMTNPSAKRWGFVASSNSLFASEFCNGMWHVPNNWTVDDSGHFTKDYETPECKESLAFNKKLYEAGVFYPGSQGFTNTKRKSTMNAGHAFMTTDGFGALIGYWNNATTPGAQVRAMLPPGHSGGKGQVAQGPGFYSVSFMKKASEDRVKTLLGIANFLAAPFGTQEWLLVNYGVKGTDYTFDANGNPNKTNTGKSEMPDKWFQYVAGAPLVIFNPTDKKFVQVAHQDVVDTLPVSVTDPSVGLYSATDLNKGPVIKKTVTDGFTDIVAGRRPMSDYDKIVSAWRSAGGDEIKKEYEQAWEQAH